MPRVTAVGIQTDGRFCDKKALSFARISLQLPGAPFAAQPDADLGGLGGARLRRDRLGISLGLSAPSWERAARQSILRRGF